jgi:ribose 5-phosphate isomerase
MPVLQIEHKVQNFDGWKKAFDSDPVNRKKSGVRRYRIFRLVNDPDYVIIDLEFDSLNDAETALTALRNLWGQVEGKVMFNPQTRMLDIVETKEY